MKTQQLFNTLVITTVVFIAGMSRSNAALLELTHDPLFLSQSVPPAIAVTFDDSGSMERAYVIGLNDNRYARFANPLENRIYYNPNITYTPPIGPDGVQFAQANPTAARVDGFTNKIGAVNITTNYVPLYEIDYETGGTVEIEFARGGHPDLYNIRRNTRWEDEYPSNSEISWENNVSNDGVPAFYTVRNADNSYSIVNVPAAQHNNFANWYSYYNTRMKLGRTAVSRAFSTFGPSFKIAWQQLNRNTTFPDLNRFEGTHRTNFFNNWLFKVPTSGGTPLRNSFLRAGALFEDDDSYESDQYSDLISCQQNFHIAISDGGWNQDFDQTGNGSITFDESGRSPRLPGDSTAPPTINDLGQEYGEYTGAGIQRIYSKDDDLKTLSDIAFHYWSRDLNPGLVNNVKRYKKDYTTTTGAVITVPTDQDHWDVDEFVWNPKNDPAYWQHLVTYNIGLGLDSSLVEAYRRGDFTSTGTCPFVPGITDPQEAVLKGLRAGDCAWPAIDSSVEFNDVAQKVDDVWHASVNSRGDFFSATDPQELIAALNSVINNILERLSSGSSSALSSGVITSGTKAFTPRFDSSNWSGNFIAREVLDTSGFGDPVWDTACILTGGYCDVLAETVPKQTTRNLHIYDKVSETLQSFSPGLTGAAGLELFLSSADVRTRLGVTVDDLIEHISGDQSQEIASGGSLRDRENVLADIVHASPLVIRGPGESYNDNGWNPNSVLAGRTSYLDFKIANQNRHNVVYVGSNGGMLHAIDAEGANEGSELWGYIPSAAIKNLPELADPIYDHKSFVDNTPVLGDAYFNDQWNSVLIGGMRYGGQAYYAINVTDTLTNTPDVLWEFTDADDADMGYSYGRATIMRVSSTDEWVALIPNGYNNSQLDFPNPSDPRNVLGDGSAVLYVVRLSDGQLLAKLDTNEGSVTTPNGMGPAVAVDSRLVGGGPNGGVDIGADYAYAGDVYGNLWRFDFRSTDYSDWSNASNIQKVVEADTILEQPITQRPRVLNIPAGQAADLKDTLVIYATGKYIELPDRSTNIPDQYIVGVFDGIDIDRSTSSLSLANSNFIEQDFSQSNGIRQITNNPVDIGDDTIVGWKVELLDQGERVNTPLILLGGQLLLVASNIPAGEDPCNAGGTGWVMAIDPRTGGLPNVGEIFDTEIETLDGDGNPITLLESGVGVLVNTPPTGEISILETPDGEAAFVIEGSDGTTVVDLRKFTWRRRNWSNLLTE